MELEYFGGNCFRVKTKQTVIIIDDNLSKLGKKSIVTDKAALFYTSPHLVDEKAREVARLYIDTPGEFEVGDITVKGVEARAHMDETEAHTATVFQLMHGGQTITFLGHIHPDASGEVMELVSGTDIVVVPVGGNGYTLDPVGAAALVKKIEPDVVIPSQYEIKDINYEIPAQPLEEFEKVSSLQAAEPQDSIKLSKSADDVTGQTRLVVLQVK